MKRLAFLLMFMLLPSLAHAQFQHANFFPTTTTLTCTATTGTNVSSDVFTGTLTGNLTLTLPASATGCLDYDVIDIRATQAASQSFTLTVNGGTGTTTKVLSNGAALLAMPTGAASGAANVLHQIWVYDSIATTPQWELVTQEVNGQAIATTLGLACSTNNVNCLTQADNTATQQSLAKIDNSNNQTFGSGVGATFVSSSTGGGVTLNPQAIVFTAKSTSVNVTNGATLQSTGGAIPTVTCSGGSTGTSVTAGSTNNRGSFVSSSSASTNCTLTWSAAGVWNQAPFCHFWDAGASITPVAYSTGACGTSTCVVDFASTTSKTIGYMCQ